MFEVKSCTILRGRSPRLRFAAVMDNFVADLFLLLCRHQQSELELELSLHLDTGVYALSTYIVI